MRALQLRRRAPAAVNLTPLLDAVFLVIVVLLSSFLHMRVIRAIKVERPVVSTGAEGVAGDKVLDVAVTEEGSIYFEERMVSLTDLGALLASRREEAEACLVTADRSAQHGRVAEVLGAASAALGDRALYVEVSERRPGGPERSAER